MMRMERYPAIPLITHDPYFSIWTAHDRMTDGETTHWSGLPQTLRGKLTVDGKEFRILGGGVEEAAQQTGVEVRATTTRARFLAAGVQLDVTFTSPLLMDDLERLSMPITLIHVRMASIDGAAHQCVCSLSVHHDVCSFRQPVSAITGDQFALTDGCVLAWMGRRQQTPLGHSGDLVTIDWGYAIAAGRDARYENDGEAAQITLCVSQTVESDAAAEDDFLLAYDDMVSMQYMGTMCKAWYAREGMPITQAVAETWAQRESLYRRCEEFDVQLEKEAYQLGGEEYSCITAIAYRQVVAAHKLIADDQGRMVFLSKENDSNGCTATVDISYPSSPMFLLYNSMLVRAFLQPILRYASSPMWPFEYAPHDIGRYPYATGQAYGLGMTSANVTRGTHHGNRAEEMETYPPFYLYPTMPELFDEDYQMPIEECGNMLILMAACLRADGDASLAQEYHGLLKRWKDYLAENGKDPGQQLTTDDFAGHTTRSMNLAAKALLGVACYAYIAGCCGWDGEAEACQQTVQEMADFWKAHIPAQGCTPLSFGSEGWSMKYNMIWDKLFGFSLFEQAFYENEVDEYLCRCNTYGCPLDSRASYTKSDWLVWCASMTENGDKFQRMIRPLARYLEETPTRVPFGDWYDTVTGRYMRFIARSVQGGVFMPLLKKAWAAQPEKGV